MKATDLFVKCLENEGVTHIFGVPGEENLDLLNSLHDSNITFIVTRHEQSAGFMAATYGRLTGTSGVCLATLGPGATNLVTAAAYAQLGGMPMVMITGQKPIKHGKQAKFQIIDTVDMMRPLTKYAKQVVHGDTIPEIIRNAFKYAEEERPGAVHIELPKDIAIESTTVEPFTINPPRRSVAEHKAISRAVEMIQTSKRPLISVGAGANRKLVSKTLKELVEKTGIPVFSTQMGKGVFDERDPHALGTAALLEHDYIHCAIEEADLIITLGYDVMEKPPFIMNKEHTTVIHINFYSAAVDSVYSPQLEVIGDIANALWQIKEEIAVQSHWEFETFFKMKKRVEAHHNEKSESTSFPLLPQRIVSDLRESIPEDGILALDNGIYKLWVARAYQAYAPNTVLLDNALATMGAGLPSAIAAKLTNPDKKVVALAGDGGFMMNSQELETAIRLDLGLVIVVLNDNGFGMIKWEQDMKKFPRFGLDFGNPDFIKYAESYGAKGYRVEKTGEFKQLLSSVINEKGVHLIEVPVDYSENDRVLTRELREKTC